MKPALLVLQVLEQLGKQIRLVDCPPTLERQVRDAIGGVEVDGQMYDAGLVQVGAGTLAQIAEEAAMILGFLRRDVPMRLQKGEPWDDGWEWQARGFALMFLLPAGLVLNDWLLCRDVTKLAAAWHVTHGFMVERLKDLGALV